MKPDRRHGGVPAADLRASREGPPSRPGGSATQDVDIVIETDPRQIDAVARRFGEVGLYVDHGAAQEACRTRGQFNVIDPELGWKANFIVCKDGAFSAGTSCSCSNGGGTASIASTCRSGSPSSSSSRNGAGPFEWLASGRGETPTVRGLPRPLARAMEAYPDRLDVE